VFEAAVADGHVTLAGHTFDVNIIDPKRLRGSASGSGHDHGHAEIRTAMPGKVVRILKAAGDSVTKGEGVIVVEAMKMQNEMKSPRDGTIGEIRVSEGDTVGAGDVLVVID
jgi:biotin carboxyl carrier protein